MKKIIYISVFLIIGIIQNAHTQNIGDLNGIYYQAVAVDDNGKEIVGMDVNGKPLYNKEIGVRFTITKGLNGTIEWEETQTTTTDKYGLFTLIIGQGTPTGNSVYSKLLDIPWIDADQFLKVEIATKNDGNYKLVSNQQLMAVPYSFYTDDIADDAITTQKILDSTIINQDVQTNAIDSRAISNETILAEDINSGAVTTSEILDSTIVNQDVQTGSIDSRTILNKTISTDDINAGAITSTEILNSTILNEDIANNTINISTKVTDTLAVTHGGTGNGSFITGNILVGDDTNPLKSKVLACPDSTLDISQTSDSILIRSTFSGTEVTSDPAGTFVIGNLPAGSTYTSNAINAFVVNFGDIIIGSIDVDLKGCMLTAYVSQPNVIRISVFNGTGSAVNLGTVNVKVYIVK